VRKMIGLCVAGLLLAAPLCHAQAAPNRAALGMTLTKMDPAKQKDWLARWGKALVKDVAGFRVCDTVLGEDLGFVMTPAMDSFYYGYMATKDPMYVDMLVDWTDALIKRAVKEPDGYVGWPCLKAAGTDVDNLDNTYNADSMLGEAMVFRPIVQMAREMMTAPALKEKYGAKGESYVKFAERLYAKWAERGGWRLSGEGGLISLVLPYGMDPTHTRWIDYDTRNTPGRGFSHPDNKANEVARWMLAMWDATGKPEYKEHAEKWFRVMKSRMKLKSDGTYEVWNYWQPAGPWDYAGSNTKHWVDVHPRGGYYEMDTRAIVAAYEHGLVFTKTEIDQLIATAESTWTGGAHADPSPGMVISVHPASGMVKQVNACFANTRISEPMSAGPGALLGTVVSRVWDTKTNTGNIVIRPKNAPTTEVTVIMNDDTRIGVLRLWTALAPYDVEIQKHFEDGANPDSWFGFTVVPWYLMLQSELFGR
jgi:hypothetical protein